MTIKGRHGVVTSNRSYMFQQILDPIAGSLAISALCAALPLLLLFVLLGVFKVKAPKAALASLALSLVLAIVGWQMPVGQALSATAAGLFFGVFPILWILINAVWIYRLTVATRWFEVLGRALGSITRDHRILAILIAFCFGALMEALAGFGAPVAIAVAMLMVVGMSPVKAAVVALVADTAPVAFGGMAVPITALSGVTGLRVHDLASMVGRQTPIIALLIPLVLVFIVDGKRGVKQTWPVALVAGAVFGIVQFLASNYFVVELTDVVAALASILAILVMLRFWQPTEIIGAAEIEDGNVAGSVRSLAVVGTGTTANARVGEHEGGRSMPLSSSPGGGPVPVSTPRPSAREIWMGVAPYLIITVIFSLSQIPAVKSWLAAIGTLSFQWPGLDVVNAAGKPVAAQKFTVALPSATGTLLLLSGLATMLLYKISPRQGLRIYWETLKHLRWTIVTVTAVLALSFLMNLSGQASTLGVFLASTGGFFAVLSPLIGWIGVALTGSDTSSNSLFGQLQVAAAVHTGLPPVLMAASNSAGGVIGKMLSVQNLAVASAAIGIMGSEGILFRKLVGWSLLLLALITVLVLLQSTPVLGWMVP